MVRLELVSTRGELMEQWFRSPGGAVLRAGAEDWVFERSSEEAFGPATPMPLHHLITCVEQRATPAATIRDARDSFVVAMAAYASAREGRPVRVDTTMR